MTQITFRGLLTPVISNRALPVFPVNMSDVEPGDKVSRVVMFSWGCDGTGMCYVTETEHYIQTCLLYHIYVNENISLSSRIYSCTVQTFQENEL